MFPASSVAPFDGASVLLQLTFHTRCQGFVCEVRRCGDHAFEIAMSEFSTGRVAHDGDGITLPPNHEVPIAVETCDDIRTALDRARVLAAAGQHVPVLLS